MANPKKRKTHSKSRMGRAHLALKKTSLTKCPHCGQMRRPHTACSFCGNYKERAVTKPKSKVAKKK